MIQYAVILTPIFFISCLISGVPKNTDQITGFKVTENFPEVDPNGKLKYYYTFSTKVYQYNNQVLYHGTYKFDSVVQRKTLVSEMRDYFFVYNKSNPYGLYYDSSKNIYGKKLLVDSVIKKEWINNINIYQGYSDSKLIPVTITEKPNPGESIKVFFFQSARDTGLRGVFRYWFSNTLNHIDYSFSKELDSIYNMKLYKIIIENNSLYIKDQDITLDPIKQYFELEEITVNNRSVLMKYFEEEKKGYLKK